MASLDPKIDRLTSKNYNTWKTIVTASLKGKDLWDYVITSKMADRKEEIKNEQAKSIIYGAMEPHQVAATGVCISANELWTKIQENHEGTVGNLKMASLQEFYNIAYRKNESITSFAGRYETLLGRLESTGHKVDNHTKIWVFTHTLPPAMKTTVQIFTISKPTGLVEDLISQLKIQHHLDNQQVEQQACALYASNKPSNGRNGDKRQQGNGKPANQQNAPGMSCTYCKKVGHLWKECRKLKADNERKKKFGSDRNSGNKGSAQTSYQAKSTMPYRPPQQQRPYQAPRFANNRPLNSNGGNQK